MKHGHLASEARALIGGDSRQGRIFIGPRMKDFVFHPNNNQRSPNLSNPRVRAMLAQRSNAEQANVASNLL